MLSVLEPFLLEALFNLQPFLCKLQYLIGSSSAAQDE